MRTFLLALFCSMAWAEVPLGVYHVDEDQVSVSGISSGATMATQFHVAYSSHVMGVGMFAGPPYWCSHGNFTTAIGPCMNNPNDIDMKTILDKVDEYETKGEIDPKSSMADDKVFLLHGLLDSVVAPGTLSRVKEFYLNFVDSSNIMAVSNLASGHTQPTSHYGNPCNTSESPWISDCSYQGAYIMLNHIYGNLVEPSSYGGKPPGDFHLYDQSEFFDDDPQLSSMDTEGYVYVPTGCNKFKKKKKVGKNDDPDSDQKSECKLHIVFHGCRQGKWRLGDEFPMNTGYNEVGEANNIIMLYPQAVSSESNPYGCWDWWGYNIPNVYATQIGHQNLAVCRMVAKLIGSSHEEYCPKA